MKFKKFEMNVFVNLKGAAARGQAPQKVGWSHVYSFYPR